MSKKSHQWSIIDFNGSCTNYEGDFWQICETVYVYSKFDKRLKEDPKLMPNVLFMDGKIVMTGFGEFAVQYGAEREEKVLDAISATRMKHFPTWLASANK